MLKNYVVTALRNIRKNTLTSFITICGFSIGIACALFIFLYVQHELSFDKFLFAHERTYRVLLKAKANRGGEFLTSSINMDIRNSLLAGFPGIESLTQIMISDGHLGHEDRFFYEQNNMYCTDASFLKVFSYPLSAGDRETALEKPMSMVVSGRMARKYFGDQSPIGKMMSFKTMILGDKVYYFVVTGVLAPLPQNSSFQFDFVANCPFEELANDAIKNYTKAYNILVDRQYSVVPVQTYIRLKSNVFLGPLQEFLKGIAKTLFSKDQKFLYTVYEFLPEPLDSIYFFSSTGSPAEKRGNFTLVLLLIGLGVIVILIACTNVINLTTARALTRVKEIGIRKALGASRRELMLQYLVESVLLSFISLWFAVILVEVFLPLFNVLIRRSLSVHYLENPAYLLAVVGVTLFVGVLAGFYPAFYLSSFDAAKVLKGQKTPSSRRFREIIVVAQFVLSIGLFVISSIILGEFQFVKITDTGFNAKDMLMVRLNIPAIETKYQDLKNAVAAVPGVMGACGTSFAAWEYGQLVKDYAINGFGGTKHADVMVVDSDYLKVCGIKLIQGQDFTEKINSIRNTQLIVNEAAQKQLGYGLDAFIYEDPLTGRIVGVTKNFDYVFPARGMKPLILTMLSPFLINNNYTPVPVHLSYLLVKLAPEGQQKIIQELERLWKKMNPGYSFDYKFIEHEISSQLDDVNRSFESVLYVSTVLAFLLSGLGLFGLASFEMERRTKEIGIRKAVGATSMQVVAHFLLGFLKLVALANVIAWPLTFLSVRIVFELIQYPHPLVIGPLIFLEAGVISVVVMALTVGAQTLRAASANPVNSLRYE